MPEPTLGDVHVDAPLTDFSRAYFQPSDKYIWNRVFGTVASPKQSDKYFVYDKDNLLRIEARKRAPNTESAGRDYSLSTDNFYCDVWSLHSDVSEFIRSNADTALDPEQDAAMVIAQDINATLDVEFVSTLFTTSVWGTDKTVGTQWNDAASTPIQDVEEGKETVEKNTGFEPNTLVMGREVWTDLKHHPDILARLPDNAPRTVSTAFLAQLFDVPRVFVARSIRNTAQQGLTGSYSFNFGKHALLAYANPNPGLRAPQAANAFVWTGLIGSVDGIRSKRMNLPWKDALPRVETDAAVGFKVVGSDLGYFFSSVVA